MQQLIGGLLVSQVPWMIRNAEAAGPAAAKGGARLWAIATHSTRNYDGTTVTSLIEPGPGLLRAWSPDGGKHFEVKTPFEGHQVSQSPREPELFFTSQKWGPMAAMVNLRSRKVVRTATLPKGQRHFGHGAFAADGKTLYCSVMDDVKNEGFIVQLDLRLKELRRFPSHGKFPHQVELSRDGKALLVMIGDAPESGLRWLDPSSGALQKKVALPVQEEWGVHHFAQSADGYIVAGGGAKGTKTPPMYVVDPEGNATALSLPADEGRLFRGQAISVALCEEQELAALTLVNSGRIGIFNYRTRKLVRDLLFPGPSGVASVPEESAFYFTSNSELSFARYPAESLRFDAESRVQSAGRGGGGSHLTLARFSG